MWPSSVYPTANAASWCAPSSRSCPAAKHMDLSRLQAFLRGCGLAILKLPERLEVVDELPRNALGKVLKAELRARFS